MTSPRVRFAPSPTGYLHVGGARTALVNWLYARRHGGTFILRIEDTDAERSRQELIDVVLDTLEWLGLDWDEGPYRQSERAELYAAAVDKLMSDGRAYRCDCTRDDVVARAQAEERKTPGYDGYCRDRDVAEGPETAVRFRTPDDGEIAFDDLVRDHVSVEARTIEDFVIRRADDSPTFLLANAVDDADMGITHAIRGEDLLNTVPKVLALWDALGYGDPPTYAHLPLLVDESRKKLSKRRHSVAVGEYRDAGYLPEAFANFLALLGWGPPDGVEIRPLDEITDLFDLADVTKAGAFFDTQKLDHFNGEYIRALDSDAFVARAAPFFEGFDWVPAEFPDDRFGALAPLVQERCTTLADAPELVDFIYLPEPAIDEKSWEKAMVKNEHAAAILDAALEAYSECEWTADVLHESLRDIGEGLGLKLGKTQAPVRVAVTGRTVGPPLFESLEVLGRETTLERMRAARARLGSPS